MGGLINHMVLPLYPQEIATVPIVQEAVWRTLVDLCEEEKISFPLGVRNPKPSIL
jgi:hypothetical protein